MLAVIAIRSRLKTWVEALIGKLSPTDFHAWLSWRLSSTEKGLVMSKLRIRNTEVFYEINLLFGYFFWTDKCCWFVLLQNKFFIISRDGLWISRHIYFSYRYPKYDVPKPQNKARKQQTFLLLNKFSLSVLQNTYWERYGEYAYWC